MDDDALERMYARIRADNKAWAEGEQQRKATRMQRYLKLANRMASKIPQREEKVRSRLKRYLQEKHDVSGPLSNEELQGYLEAWLPRGWLEIKQRRMAEAIEDDDIRRSTYAALLWTTHAEEETTKMHCEDYLDFWDEGDKVYWTYELDELICEPQELTDSPLETEIRAYLEEWELTPQRQPTGQPLWVARLLMYCNAKSPLNLIAFCDSSKFRLFICRVAIRISDGYECVLHQLYIEACDKSYHRGNGRKECISAAKERFVACWQDFPETVVDGLKFPYEASEEQQSTFHEVYDVAKEMFHNIDCGRLFPFAKEYADEQVAECEARLNLALRKLRVFDSGSMHLRGEQDMGSLTRAKMRNIFKEWIEVVITLSPVKKAYLVLGRSVIMDKSSALK